MADDAASDSDSSRGTAYFTIGNFTGTARNDAPGSELYAGGEGA